MPRLVVLLGQGELNYELGEGQNLIGRLPHCRIPISHPTASGRHAVIYAQGGDYELEDVGSRNGTFVNQQRIAGRVKLNHNDVIRFGEVRARFCDPAHTQAVRGSLPATVALREAHGDLGEGCVGIRDKCTATITSEMLAAGRFGGLDVNPEAKLKAVLEISNGLAGTLDLAALLPKILDSLFSIFSYADRAVELVQNGPTEAEALARALLADVRRHARGCPQSDDISIMVFGRGP